MDFETLLRKHDALLAENEALKEENLSLKMRLGLAEPLERTPITKSVCQEASLTESFSPVTAKADPAEKIRLFMSLFKGREDIYAKRWESKDGARAGFTPACQNERKPGLCRKFKVKCASCSHRSHAPLDQNVVDAHLRGIIIAGVYPLLQDETCHFLAIDFDKEGWQEDAGTIRDVCGAFNIPVAFERSRSGQGAHAWFFFTDPVSASLARRFGSALLTHAMSKRHEIKFKSYDRLFPNQATMPRGGFGNLIALLLRLTIFDSGSRGLIESPPLRDESLVGGMDEN